MKRLIASDYDGTINCGGDSIPMNAVAIREWRAAGNLFGIVTGRGVGIAKELKENGVETDFILCNNGSVCLRDGELIFVERNDIHLIPGLADFIVKNGAGYFGLVAPEGERGFMGHDIPADLLDSPDFAQLTAICGNDDDASRIAEAVNKEYDGRLIAYPNGRFIDIVKYGVSKATGVSRVAQMLGVEEAACHTVGDNLNDLVMIEAFDGYAVAGAREQVKEKADHVVDSVADMIRGLLAADGK